MIIPSRAIVNDMRVMYPAGSRIRIVRRNGDDPTGAVVRVDNHGTIHVKLDNGSHEKFLYGSVQCARVN